MRSMIALFSLLFTVSLGLAPFRLAEKSVPSQYIVVLKEGVMMASHLSSLEEAMKKENPANEILHKYEMPGFQGYALRCSRDILDYIRSFEDVVAYVEEDSFVSVFDVQNNPPSWGLDRTSQVKLPLTNTYRYPSSAGAGVDMYTIDTGIYISHNDYSSRAKWGFTAPSGASDDDKNGHGTHCSGTMAGTQYGIAKKANLIAVKVLGDLGFGSTADVIAGVNWVQRQHSAGKKSVGNMSLGGGASSATDDAVNACVRAGVFMAVAAGNDNANACNYSPARASEAVCVGSTDSSDRKSSFSNYGSCVDIHAPGSSITSSWIGGTSASRTISGTSMASPHVAGVMALYLAEGLTPTAKALQDAASKDVISGLPSGTVNLLLFSDDNLGKSQPKETQEPRIFF